MTIKTDQVEFTSTIFSGGEIHIQIESVDYNVIDVELEINNSDDLMEYLNLDNALFYYLNAPVQVNLAIDYLPYARQDRVCARGQSFSLEVLAGILNNLRNNTVIIFKDVHSKVSTDIIRNSFNVPQLTLIKSVMGNVLEDIDVLVAPDKGARDKVYEISEAYPDMGLVIGEKVRDPLTGDIVETRLTNDVVDLTGKVCLIPDDICDGGRTFIELAKVLKDHGAPKVVLYVTHGIFSKGLDVFDDLIDEIYCFNLVNKPKIDTPSCKTKLFRFKN